MALTDSQRKAKESAELELLITNVMSAMRRNNMDAVTAALRKVDEFRSWSTFDDLVRQAGEVLDKATDDLIDDAIGALGVLVGQLDATGASFKSATEIAKTGKKELLLPLLAANAAKSLEFITQFEAGVEKLIDDMEAINDMDVENIKDVGEVVKAVKQTMEKLKSKVEEIS